ncbi:MAG: hypothetical protein LAT62_14875 [Natronospirillum sp.]|uniref:hypothetical protein n=1 Tax=Natronospirillum sp. TaxID=2812955 RepID=UPI0025D3565F|nr:hypothetical protein [Natronospirillum sp.]MCH8553219.1 hypothetical protein [Natronospirillum sp.]
MTVKAEEFDKTFGVDADYRGEDEEYPVADWQHDVADGDTRLGYWDWVVAQRESDTYPL